MIPVVPEGRYGHIASALGNDRMLIFGGRGLHGKLLNDTWVYYYNESRWEQIRNNEILQVPGPSGRLFSSCALGCERFKRKGDVSLPTDVYMFGGTDGVENFGDLWLFKGDESIMRWERLVAVGLPPYPRYGHSFLRISDDLLAIVGGCGVSPQGEMVGSNISPNETKILLELSQNLQKRYIDENKMASISGLSLEQMIDDKETSFLDLFKKAGSISSTFHQLESNTRSAEKELVDTFNITKATTNFNIKKSRHPYPNLDVMFLHVKEVMWKTQLFPPIKGTPPKARAHFSANCIGDFMFIVVTEYDC